MYRGTSTSAFVATPGQTSPHMQLTDDHKKDLEKLGEELKGKEEHTVAGEDEEDVNHGADDSEDAEDEDAEDENDYTELDVDIVCQFIKDAAREAEKTGDYISYATVIDIHCSDPSRYKHVDRVKILTSLLEVLRTNPKICEEIGWDLPALLLPYFNVEDFDFNDGLEGHPTFYPLIMLFSTLAEYGNPKELFLKTVETLSTLTCDRAPENDKLKFKQAESLRKFEVCKFHVLEELMSSCMKKIKTQYPSRFLASAASAILMFSARNAALFRHFPLIVGILARRVYVFIRDWGMDGDEPMDMSPDEQAKSAKILQSLSTYFFYSWFHRVAVRWSSNLFREIKHSIHELPRAERAKYDNPKSNGSAVYTIYNRWGTLALSLDLDPSQYFLPLIQEIQEDVQEATKGGLDDTLAGFSKSSLSDASPIAFVDYSMYDDASEIPLSQEGLLMLATQYMMENRDHSLNISLDQLVSMTLYLVHRSSPKEPLPFAITDLLLFWGWWTLKDMERPEVRQLDEAFYVKYLQFLVFISASSPLPEIRNIAYTLCGRLLYLQHESVSFAFIADTIADCPFENAQVAMVGILKRLMIPDEISDQLSKLRIPDVPTREGVEHQKASQTTIPTTPEHVDTIKSLCNAALEQENTHLVITWLNFLSTVKLDCGFAGDYAERVEKVIDEVEDENDRTLIRLALDVLAKTV